MRVLHTSDLHGKYKRLLAFDEPFDVWVDTGDFFDNVGRAPKTDYRRGPQPKINDLEAFRAFAEEYGHLTQKEMAEKWPEPISDASIREALRKIEFTRKKDLSISRER